MRYFASMNADFEPGTLFRLDVDTPNKIAEGVFAGGQWRDAHGTIVKALVTGSNDYDEVSEEYARAAFPAATTRPPSPRPPGGP